MIAPGFSVGALCQVGLDLLLRGVGSVLRSRRKMQAYEEGLSLAFQGFGFRLSGHRSLRLRVHVVHKIAYTLALKESLCGTLRAEVSTMWAHGPLGYQLWHRKIMNCSQ